MNPSIDRHPKPRRPSFEIVDVELAHVFYTDQQSMVVDYVNAIESLGHRAIIKEVKP